MARGFLSLGVVAGAADAEVEVAEVGLLGPLYEVPRSDAPRSDAGLFAVGFLSFLHAASGLFPCCKVLSFHTFNVSIGCRESIYSIALRRSSCNSGSRKVRRVSTSSRA